MHTSAQNAGASQHREGIAAAAAAGEQPPPKKAVSVAVGNGSGTGEQSSDQSMLQADCSNFAPQSSSCADQWGPITGARASLWQHPQGPQHWPSESMIVTEALYHFHPPSVDAVQGYNQGPGRRMGQLSPS